MGVGVGSGVGVHLLTLILLMSLLTLFGQKMLQVYVNAVCFYGSCFYSNRLDIFQVDSSYSV